MNEISQNLTYYMRYRDIEKQRAREYYVKNIEKIQESQREKYKNLSSEEKKNLVLKQKEWFNKQTKEKQDKMSRKARSTQKIDIIIMSLLLIRFDLMIFCLNELISKDQFSLTS